MLLLARLSSNGYPIDQRADRFGELKESTAETADAGQLRRRLEEDGYLFLRGVLDGGVLLRAQRLIETELLRLGLLDPKGDRTVDLLPARPGRTLYKVMDGLDTTDLQAVTRQPALMTIFESIFGESARPLDYTWPRASGPGRCELPHSDWPYMSRGTSRLFTAWIPLMDLPRNLGPLMILEQSHRPHEATRSYLERDADRLGMFDALRFKHGSLVHGGRYSRRPDRVQLEFGTRWLTADYRLGDVVIFSPRGLHATLDNLSGGFRASLDCRFQPASDAVDPRFDGLRPVAHAQRDRNIFEVVGWLKAAFQALRGREFAVRTRAPRAKPVTIGFRS